MALQNVEVNQFSRKYSGDFEINFPILFSKINDIKTINYSNFYLTNKKLIEDCLFFQKIPLISKKISTRIAYSDQFLSYREIDKSPYLAQKKYRESLNYYCPFFEDSVYDYFYIEFFDYNRCNIYITIKNVRFYLIVSAEEQVVFCNENLLSFNPSTINPQDLTYVYSESTNGILLFKDTQNGGLVITKSGNTLLAKKNTIDFAYVPFTLDRDIFNYPDANHNTSFITYDNTNNIDNLNSLENIENNYLVHKKIIDNTQTINVICLKNQLPDIDIFTNANNLLSATNQKIFVEDFRDYTSISQDIIEEESNDLKLNYVCSNRSYIIKPGVNVFTAPETLYPFKKLNINDTDFINAGAFSFISPQFADKVYHISDKKNERENGQYLLCTWLSGHPNSPEKMWVDRYYYPDLIAKEDALLSTNMYDSTYDDYIESIIMGDNNTKERVADIMFFDKKSDLVFTENDSYEYHRIKYTPETITAICATCGYDDCSRNYYKEINDIGKFTLYFYFEGSKNWNIKSGTNEINSGVSISCSNGILSFTYTLYDPFNMTYVNHEYTSPISDTQYNLFCMSIDNISGYGYVFINNKIVYEIRLDPYKYIKNQLINGDFVVTENANTEYLLNYNSKTFKDIIISKDYLDSSYLYIDAIFQSNTTNDICITLPCGMRNHLDHIKILNDVCNSGAFKSNSINVIIKNIDSPELLMGLDQHISDNVTNHIPTNVDINSIIHKNFKNK